MPTGRRKTESRRPTTNGSNKKMIKLTDKIICFLNPETIEEGAKQQPLSIPFCANCHEKKHSIEF